MSYLVFARKWRPQSFGEVLAQEHVTITLRNAIDSGRTGHAYLFAGPRGVGKTTTARILAKALNCEKGPTSEPCQVCESCTRIAAGTDMDVLEIDGASNRGIDEIRDLREKARYSASAGRWKIYIIDEVHMLTREAFNALLKILEEPPEFVAFVFATTEPRKVPATIISRCQRFDFRRIPSPVMAEYLAREAEGEGIPVEREALSLVCRASGGSMRDALSLMDQLVSFSGGSITLESAESLLRVVEHDLLASMFSAVFAGRGGEALDMLAGALSGGYSVEEVCDASQEFLRNLMLVAAGGVAGLDEMPDREAETLRRIAGAVSDVAVLDTLRIISSAAAETRTSSLPRVVLESALLTASELRCAVGVSDLPPSPASRVPGKAPQAQPRPVRQPGPATAPAPDPVPEGRAPAGPAPSAGEPPAPEEDAASPVQGGEDPPAAEATPTPAPAEDAASGQGGQDEEKEITRSLLDLFDAVPYENHSDGRQD